jgi:hypothetical protein
MGIGMSFVGDPYRYDVFFSYAYAEGSTNTTLLRDWSRLVAESLRMRLESALNGDRPGDRRFSYFMDTSALRDETVISQTLVDAARQSALIVVFLSPYYWQSAWCQAELKTWFGDMANSRDPKHCVPLLIQKPIAHWPELLMDKQKNQFKCQYFYDEESNDPIYFNEFLPKALPPALVDPVRSTIMTIKNRLSEIEDLLRAAREKQAMDVSKSDLVLFLESETADVGNRAAIYDELYMDARVVPDNTGDDFAYIPGVVNNDTQRIPPIQYIKECNSLVLLRCRPNDQIQYRILKAFNDKKTILNEPDQKNRRSLSWAVLNELLGTPVPNAKMFNIPVVDKTGDWKGNLISTLR